MKQISSCFCGHRRKFSSFNSYMRTEKYIRNNERNIYGIMRKNTYGKMSVVLEDNRVFLNMRPAKFMNWLWRL